MGRDAGRRLLSSTGRDGIPSVGGCEHLGAGPELHAVGGERISAGSRLLHRGAGRGRWPRGCHARGSVGVHATHQDPGCVHWARHNAEQFSVGGAAATGPRWQCVHRAGDRKLDWTKLPSAVGLYGCCIAGRRHWRGLAGRCRQVAGPPAVGGDGREGGRAARGEGRRRRSTVPETPGGAEARLADVDAPVTTNPEWPDTPRRRRGGRSVA